MEITITNIQEADSVFDRFAVVKSRLAKRTAAWNAKIARMKSEMELDLADDTAAVKELEDALRDFCEAESNRVFFTSPRKRKCENGSYGLQSSTEVETEPGFDAEAETVRLGIELCKRTVKPDLTLIKDALTAGEDVRGAHLKAKETFKYSLKG